MRFLIFLIIVQNTASLLYVLDIIHYENIINNILNRPEIKQGEKLLRTIQSYMSLLNNITKDLKRFNKDVFKGCKILFDKGWPDFLKKNIENKTIHDFKEILKLNSEQVTSIEVMFQECAALYFQFLVSYFEVSDSINSSTTSKMI